MSSHTSQPQNTFVVRFWWELQEDRHWRGRIEHLQSDTGTTFDEAGQLLAFIQRFVTPLESQTPGDVSSEMEGGSS
ncbi:MAG: hypothetical protein KJ606_10100 [Chloroflexi bacterium]|nr:hypothetical protein [Chloroflexota bacterium]